MKECVICNMEFEPIARNGKICSDECRRLKKLEYSKKWRDNNKEKSKAYREKTKGRMSEWRKANREHLKEMQNKWYAKNYEHATATAQKWRDANRDKVRQNKNEWYHNNKNDPNKSIIKSKPRVLERQRIRRRDPSGWHNTPMRKINHLFATQVRRSIRCFVTMKESNKTFAILGFTKEELHNYLESLFQDGMSWDNISEWHIDHIRPVSSFNFDSTDHPDFKKCWALENLQPLWSKDNLVKGNKWNGEVNA